MYRRFVLGLGLLAIPSLVQAVSYGQAADNVFEPVAFATWLMELACYATGGALVIGAAVQYRIHRQNPKLVPLFTPILMTFLGIVTMGIPFLTTMFENSWSASEMEKGGSTGDLRPHQKPIREGTPDGGHWGGPDDTDYGDYQESDDWYDS